MRSKDRQGQKPEEESEEKKAEKGEVPITTLAAITTVNRFYEATAGTAKKLSQIMDTDEHLENQYWTCCSRQKNIMNFFI
jgi:hypothetical protein